MQNREVFNWQWEELWHDFLIIILYFRIFMRWIRWNISGRGGRLFLFCIRRRYRLLCVCLSLISSACRLVLLRCLLRFGLFGSSSSIGCLPRWLGREACCILFFRRLLLTLTYSSMNTMIFMQSRYLSLEGWNRTNSWYWTHLLCRPRWPRVMLFQFHGIISFV